MGVPEKHRPLAHAFIDGADIQQKVYIDGRTEWWDDSRPSWYEGIEYRVKPKAKVKKWRWVDGHPAGLIYAASNRNGDIYFTEAEAVKLGFLERIDATMIEVDE